MIIPVFEKGVPKSQRLPFAKSNNEILLLFSSNFYAQNQILISLQNCYFDAKKSVFQTRHNMNKYSQLKYIFNME